MKDFTREELAAFRDKLMSGSSDETLDVSPEAVLRLIDMASRAVSEETVRKLAKYQAISAATELDDDHDDDGESWCDFAEAAYDDLEAAAEALARSAGEGKDG